MTSKLRGMWGHAPVARARDAPLPMPMPPDPFAPWFCRGDDLDDEERLGPASDAASTFAYLHQQVFARVHATAKGRKKGAAAQAARLLEREHSLLGSIITRGLQWAYGQSESALASNRGLWVDAALTHLLAAVSVEEAKGISKTIADLKATVGTPPVCLKFDEALEEAMRAKAATPMTTGDAGARKAGATVAAGADRQGRSASSRSSAGKDTGRPRPEPTRKNPSRASTGKAQVADADDSDDDSAANDGGDDSMELEVDDDEIVPMDAAEDDEEGDEEEAWDGGGVEDAEDAEEEEDDDDEEGEAEDDESAIPAGTEEELAPRKPPLKSFYDAPPVDEDDEDEEEDGSEGSDGDMNDGDGDAVVASQASETPAVLPTLAHHRVPRRRAI